MGGRSAQLRVSYHVLALPLPEQQLISRIRKAASGGRFRGVLARPVLVGIGDDASVLAVHAGHEILVTTDFSLEGVHFRRQWHPPESVGHRCLARGLSDIAAMGGEPLAAFLSLALPKRLPQKWVDRFLTGLLKLAKESKVKLAGGDTAESPGGVLADILMIGSVPPGRAIVRSEARPGDRIYVTGELGGSAAALRLFYTGKKKLKAADYSRHFFPEPRIAVGRVLREKQIATSMIDLSDGLSTDLAHICEESGCGAEIQQELIPLAKIGKSARQVELEFALHGGEDYELLFTAPPNRRVPSRIEGVPVTEIGFITKRKERLLLVSAKGRTEFIARGWEHFHS